MMLRVPEYLVGMATVYTRILLGGFSGDLYGQSVRMEFYKFLREEKRFGSLEELREEVRHNAQQTEAYFRENKQS